MCAGGKGLDCPLKETAGGPKGDRGYPGVPGLDGKLFYVLVVINSDFNHKKEEWRFNKSGNGC